MTEPNGREYLPPDIRNYQVMSWCPFCYLGWPRYEGTLFGNSPFPSCLINLPTFSAMTHVPAIRFDPEADNPAAQVANMLKPRPWEVKRFMAAGVDPRRMIRPVPGLAEALASGRCITCAATRTIWGDPTRRCDDHLRPSEREAVAA